MKLTRRKLAMVLTSPVLTSPVLTSGAALAQTPSPPARPDDLLRAARERNQNNSKALDAEQIPMATEPAFQFKA